MPTNPAIAFRKSSTSTEVWYAEVKGKSTTGGVFDPTALPVSAATVRISNPADVGIDRAPIPADYVAMTWETWTGPRYMVRVLMGPLATLNPAGPTASEADVTHQLWIQLVAGSETPRFPAGLFAVTP